jgi:hypothetical protein
VLFSIFSLSAEASDSLNLRVTIYQENELKFEESFSRSELLEVDKYEINTENPYVDEVTAFSGPRVEKLLRHIGVNIEEVRELNLRALNDYNVDIPVEDIINYPVIVSVLSGGGVMTVREKGPFWLIYPMSDNPELQQPIYNDRLIWQLSEIQVSLK